MSLLMGEPSPFSGFSNQLQQSGSGASASSPPHSTANLFELLGAQQQLGLALAVQAGSKPPQDPCFEQLHLNTSQPLPTVVPQLSSAFSLTRQLPTNFPFTSLSYCSTADNNQSRVSSGALGTFSSSELLRQSVSDANARALLLSAGIPITVNTPTPVSTISQAMEVDLSNPGPSQQFGIFPNADQPTTSTSRLSASSVLSTAPTSRSPSTPVRGERCVGCGSETCIRIHYGAPSCHGCKAFFRRSVFEGRVYLCSADNNCDITNESRNRCRSCRLRNCLDGGMNPKHVREERNKLEKLGPSSNVPESRTGTPPEEHPLTLFLTALEKQCEQLTENNGKTETRALDQLCPQAAAHFRSLELPATVLQEPMSWQCVRMVSEVDLQHAWYKTFVHLADWAMSIPDFRMLPQADQSSLFCQNLSTFGWLHFAYKCYTNGYSHLGVPIGNGSFIPYEDPGSPSANTLGRRLIDTVVHPMREMDMDEEEYCVLKTLALFQMDCALSASAHSIASRQREKILEALSTHLERKFPMMTQSQRLARAVKGTLLFPSLMVIHALYPLFSTTPVKK